MPELTLNYFQNSKCVSSLDQSEASEHNCPEHYTSFALTSGMMENNENSNGGIDIENICSSMKEFLQKKLFYYFTVSYSDFKSGYVSEKISWHIGVQ